MIYTVTLNLALDKTVEIPSFTTDGVNRITSIRTDPGGKGINVSKVVAALGSTSRVLGILGGSTGQMISEALSGLNMTCDFLPVEGNTQPYGLLHGGASVVLAEGLGSILAVITAGPGRAAVGVEINASHHRPATSGIVTGVARPISVGRSMGCYEIVITDDQGRRTCTCRLTCSLRDAPPIPR